MVGAKYRRSKNMSDSYNANSVSDDVFEEYLKKQTAKRPSGGSGTTTFTDPIKDNTWLGLKSGKYTIMRIVSAPPISVGSTLKPSPFDVHEVIRAEVKDDSGKWFPIIYPVMSDDIDHSHIMHRFINKVLEIEWSKTVKGEKSFKHKTKYPDLVDKVEHGGWDTKDRQRQYSPGYRGKRMSIMNVIDRQDMEWHRLNKKTKLLSKAVELGKDGVTEYITMGVPSFGFLKAFDDVLQTSGNWSKYDVGIKRTGEQTTPYVIKNATRLKVKDMLEDLKGVDGIPDGANISTNELLTEEELSWNLINIEEQFKPTSYFMLNRRLGKLFDECDRCLGTHFIDELKRLIEEEQKEWEALHPKTGEVEDPIESVSEPITESVSTEEVPARVVKRETIAQQATATLSAEQIAVLKGWHKLTDQEKSWIKDVVLNDDGTLNHIVYDDAAGAEAECPDCHALVPLKFKTCICGIEYAD
jgi:hypothetical protein